MASINPPSRTSLIPDTFRGICNLQEKEPRRNRKIQRAGEERRTNSLFLYSHFEGIVNGRNFKGGETVGASEG